MKVLIKNQQRQIKISRQKVKSNIEKALRFLGLADSEISVLFVNNSRMKALNSKYRGMDKATDVLSFPQIQNKIHPPPSPLVKGGRRGVYRVSCIMNHESLTDFILGDVVINLHAAKRQAVEYGHSFSKELNRLIIHGLLHLLGYDHEKSRYADRKMRKKEEELMEYLMKG